MPCPFCNPAPEDIVAKNDLAYARYDIHPVSPGHLLIIPFRHVADYFETTYEERMALAHLIDDCRVISEREHHPDGYNIGINVGEVAGQAVMHVHIHFIPRYRGDAAGEGEGGVRRSVPGKI
ncbi:MAG: HIT family protein [Methanoculleus sp.]|jgi:diadenosine tetraphosphate (Ap4A) HIT family hydrolase|nr:HIT family protein [Methanomicrobiales archaeon]NQS73001.1 HIT family protein [Methanoculleus sp.]